jgi:hypothetical protein
MEAGKKPRRRALMEVGDPRRSKPEQGIEPKVKVGDPRRLKPEQSVEPKALAVLADDWIDTSAIPERRDWTGARRGLFFRPLER